MATVNEVLQPYVDSGQYTSEQLQELRDFVELGLAVEILANPSIPAETMKSVNSEMAAIKSAENEYINVTLDGWEETQDQWMASIQRHQQQIRNLIPNVIISPTFESMIVDLKQRAENLKRDYNAYLAERGVKEITSKEDRIGFRQAFLTGEEYIPQVSVQANQEFTNTGALQMSPEKQQAYEHYVSSGQYTEEQLNEIRLGLENDLPIQFYSSRFMDYQSMNHIRNALEQIKLYEVWYIQAGLQNNGSQQALLEKITDFQKTIEHFSNDKSILPIEFQKMQDNLFQRAEEIKKEYDAYVSQYGPFDDEQLIALQGKFAKQEEVLPPEQKIKNTYPINCSQLYMYKITHDGAGNLLPEAQQNSFLTIQGYLPEENNSLWHTSRVQNVSYNKETGLSFETKNSIYQIGPEELITLNEEALNELKALMTEEEFEALKDHLIVSENLSNFQEYLVVSGSLQNQFTSEQILEIEKAALQGLDWTELTKKVSGTEEYMTAEEMEYTRKVMLQELQTDRNITRGIPEMKQTESKTAVFLKNLEFQPARDNLPPMIKYEAVLEQDKELWDGHQSMPNEFSVMTVNQVPTYLVFEEPDYICHIDLQEVLHLNDMAIKEIFIRMDEPTAQLFSQYLRDNQFIMMSEKVAQVSETVHTEEQISKAEEAQTSGPSIEVPEELKEPVAKPKKSKRESTKEVLEALKASNAEMSAAMVSMQEEIQKLREEKSRNFLEGIFHNTAKDVTRTATTCDTTTDSLLRKKEELRNEMNKTIGNLRRFQKDNLSAETIMAMEEVYMACEQDIDKAINIINEMKECLKHDTITASDKVKSIMNQVHNNLTAVGEDIVRGIRDVLTDLSNRANLWEARIHEKHADSCRKHQSKFNKVAGAIRRMDQAVREARIGLKNVIHAMKGESSETASKIPSGFSKKVIDHFTQKADASKLQADEYQSAADLLRETYGKKASETQEIQEEESKTKGFSR